jgi:hypothetical protein
VSLETQICYQASSAAPCAGGADRAAGSWRLTLSSVDPYIAPDAGDSDRGSLFVTHGHLDATLVKIVNATAVADAGAPTASTANVSLTF